MPSLNQNNLMFLIRKTRKFFYLIFFCLIVLGCFFSNVKKTYADLKVSDSEETQFIRSIESLRDLDYQTWQLIVYPSLYSSKNLILRIVGYPGSLRFDHPTDLIVTSGRKNWYLQDLTKKSKPQIEDLNDSVAEFDLQPLMTNLKKNRPLILFLPGLINELAVPPYLVSEWRSLLN